MGIEQLIQDRAEVKKHLPPAIDKILALEQTKEFVSIAKKLDLTVVMIQGTWDLSHAGHTQHIREASKHADLVLMRLASNEYASMVKGGGRPIEQFREQVVSEFELVDGVFFDDSAIHPSDIIKHARILAAINPHKIALETEDEHFEVKTKSINHANAELESDIELVILKNLPYLESTSGIIAHILKHGSSKR